MSFDVHLFADVDHIDPADTQHGMTTATFFHKHIEMPFLPMKDMHLTLGFEDTEEGETPVATIISVNYEPATGYTFCHVKVFAKCDFRRTSLDDAVQWYEKHGWKPVGHKIPRDLAELNFKR
jgi:hypothetical protein